MKPLLIFQLLCLNFFRQKEQLMKIRLAKIANSLSDYAHVFLFLQLGLIFLGMFITITLINIINFRLFPYVSAIRDEVFLSLAVSSMITFLHKINKYKNDRLQKYSCYLFLIDKFFWNFKSLFFLFYINILCIKLINNIFLVYLTIPLQIFLLLFYIFAIKQNIFLLSDRLFKLNYILYGCILASLVFSFRYFLPPLASTSEIPDLFIYPLLYGLIHISTYNYKKLFNISDTAFLATQSKIKTYNVVPFIPIIFFSLFSNKLLFSFKIEILIIFFFAAVMILKETSFPSMSYESAQTFIIFMKQCGYPIKSFLLSKIWVYLYAIRGHLVCYFCYILIQLGLKYALIFLLLVIFDVLVGMVISLVYPANLFVKDKAQLLSDSKHSLSTVFIACIPLMFISQRIFKYFGNIDYNLTVKEVSLFLNMLIFLLIFLIIYSIYLFNIWSKKFIDNLCKDCF